MRLASGDSLSNVPGPTRPVMYGMLSAASAVTGNLPPLPYPPIQIRPFVSITIRGLSVSAGFPIQVDGTLVIDWIVPSRLASLARYRVEKEVYSNVGSRSFVTAIESNIGF
jgi:hypothetical protein